MGVCSTDPPTLEIHYMGLASSQKSLDLPLHTIHIFHSVACHQRQAKIKVESNLKGGVNQMIN